MFDPKSHLMQIKGKDYLQVCWRLAWINDEVDQAVKDGKKVTLDIESEEMEFDPDKEFTAEVFEWDNTLKKNAKVTKTARGYAKYKATVTLRIDDMTKRASMVKTEKAVDFADFVEKANTGAIGRALAVIGFGTQFTGTDLDEGNRIVDAPVDRGAPQLPTFKQMYQDGKVKSMWIDQAGFYKRVAEIINLEVVDASTNLSYDQKLLLARTIENEESLELALN